jgi:hypothetical protein
MRVLLISEESAAEMWAAMREGSQCKVFRRKLIRLYFMLRKVNILTLIVSTGLSFGAFAIYLTMSGWKLGFRRHNAGGKTAKKAEKKNQFYSAHVEIIRGLREKSNYKIQRKKI